MFDSLLNTPAWLNRQAIKEARENGWSFSWIDTHKEAY